MFDHSDACTGFSHIFDTSNSFRLAPYFIPPLLHVHMPCFARAPLSRAGSGAGGVAGAGAGAGVGTDAGAGAFLEASRSLKRALRRFFAGFFSSLRNALTRQCLCVSVSVSVSHRWRRERCDSLEAPQQQ